MVGENNSEYSIEEPKKPEIPQWLIENIKGVSKSASKARLLYVSFVSYSFLTAASTSDQQLLFKRGVILPLANVSIPLDVFFRAAPLVLIGLFLFVVTFEFRLKGMIWEAETDYSDASGFRLRSWSVNGRADRVPVFIGQMQYIVHQSILWHLLPIALLAFFVKTLAMHDAIQSIVIGVLLFIAYTVTFYLEFRYYNSGLVKRVGLQGIGEPMIKWLVYMMILVVMMGFLVPWANAGFPYGRPTWISPFSSNVLRSLFCLDLRGKKLVEEPSKDYDRLYWVDLEGAHLEGADLMGCILKRANLNYANLQAARLVYATVDSAELIGASLEGANLGGAYFRNAVLRDANLTSASLFASDFRGADLENCSLAGASLAQTKLQGAKGLAVEQLSKARTLWQAEMDSSLLAQLKIGHPQLFVEP